MCDVEKYSEIFKDITSLQPEDTLQLVLEAKTEEERSFYEMIGDFLLQMKQKMVVERNLFTMKQKLPDSQKSANYPYQTFNRPF